MKPIPSENSVPHAEFGKTSPSLIEGEMVGRRYRILRTLGSGAMGEVYLADDTKLRRSVALKTIRSERCADESVVSRIKRECLLHAKIGAHPHIVALFDLIDEHGQLDLIMEYAEGETLESRLQPDREPLSVEECVGVTIQCLRALAHTHRHGIIHRDIKPANVMLIPDGAGYCAKLMDFGIARLTEAGPEVTTLTRPGGHGPGTPLYMAPEQIDSVAYGVVSPASDVYSMGIVLYQILAGRPPFEGSLTAVFNAQLNVRPKPITLPNGALLDGMLMAIISKAMNKQPSERFLSAEEFITALESWRDSVHTTSSDRLARDPWRRELARGFLRTRNGKWLAAAVAVIPFIVVTNLLSAAKKADSRTEIHPVAEAAQFSPALFDGPDPVAIPLDSSTVAEDGLVEAEAMATTSAALAAETASSEVDETIPPFPFDFDAHVAAEIAVPLDEIGDSADEPFVVVSLPPAGGESDAGIEPMADNVEGSGTARNSAVAAPENLETAAAPTVSHESTGSVSLEGLTYSVKPGDSLSKIADRYKLDVAELARWNRLRNPNALSAGQTIYLYEREGVVEIVPSVTSPAPQKNGVIRRTKNWFRKITL